MESRFTAGVADNWNLFMLNLCRAKLSDLLELVHRMRNPCANADSMESAAQQIVSTLFDNLVDNEGRPACVLARLFITQPLGSLPELLRQAALARLPKENYPEPSNVVCLTLLGSRGIEPHWNGRSGSVNHHVVPLSSPDVLNQAPMISKLVEQLGVDRNVLLVPNQYPIDEVEPQGYDVFHIEDAVASPSVPAQAGFVERYGIQSVLGFGCMLPGPSLYAVIMFTKVRVPANLATQFRPLALSVKLAVLPYTQGQVFQEENPPRKVRKANIESRMLTLETLLDLKENIAVEQTRNLEKQSEDLHRFKVMSDISSDGMLILDKEGKVSYANIAACQRLGYTQEELTAMSLPVFDPDFGLESYHLLFQRMQKGHLPAFETRHRRKNGEFFPVEVVVTPIQIDNLTYMLGVVRDITERKAAENARLTTERYYRAVTEGTLDAIVVTDKESRIQMFNAAAEKVFGFSEHEALGQSATLLMPEEDQARHLAAIQRYVKSRVPKIIGTTIEVTARRKNGEKFPAEMGVSSLELPEGLILLASFRDITERKKMQLRVAQTEKLASLGLLSAGVAHEINNPLAYVVSNLTVLDSYAHGLIALVDVLLPLKPLAIDRTELTAPIDAVIDEIDLAYIRENLDPILESTRKGVDRIAKIVKNLRGFARLDRATIEPVDLREVISSSLEMLTHQLISHGIEVVREDAPCPPVLCVGAQINQVVLNLLVNAQQSVDSAHRKDGRIILRTRGEPPWGIIEVEDNGPGIPPDALPRLFEPFFTTKPQGQGTGLGLPICHGIVTDHGGRIEIVNQPGLGATFRVYLPISGKVAHA